jgi:hypothetical protein
MCPRCGNRRVNLTFEPPLVAKAGPCRVGICCGELQPYDPNDKSELTETAEDEKKKIRSR